jgi:hypothetical protein
MKTRLEEKNRRTKRTYYSNEKRRTKMNTLTKVGLIFLILGILSFLGLMVVYLAFGAGASANPPLTDWLATLISLISIIWAFWFVFMIIGAVFIVAGHLEKRGK